MRAGDNLRYKIVVYPVSAVFAAASAVLRMFRALKASGSTSAAEGIMTIGEFEEVIRLPDYRELERLFLA